MALVTIAVKAVHARVSFAMTVIAAAATVALAWLSGIQLRRMMTQSQS